MTAPTVNVHYPSGLEENELGHLQEELSSAIRLTVGRDVPVPADSQILIAGRPSREQLSASPLLQTLVIPWSGLPAVTREVLADFPNLAVHNLHHNAVPVAELAVTLLLAAAKMVVPIDRDLREGDWRPRYSDPSPAVLLQGKTAVILGYGAIGRHAAKICRALGMNVLATRRRQDAPPNDVGVKIFSPDALPDLLPRAEALIICLPHTPATDGLIDAAALDLLPDRSVLVNIGRGPIIDQEALYRALHNGRLGGAGLDVWYNYPTDEASRRHTPPADFPFHELDNVVMSPHRGGGTRETDRLRMTHLARLLNAAARGEPLPNRVDVAAGY